MKEECRGPKKVIRRPREKNFFPSTFFETCLPSIISLTVEDEEDFIRFIRARRVPKYIQKSYSWHALEVCRQFFRIFSHDSPA